MQTIGERLEEARKKKGISVREAAEATKIRGDYLQKFESNDFDIGLTEIYTRGFLRNYANFLKVPSDRLLNDYTALGRGDVRPRQPSREIYGRMDISVATAGEPSDRAAPPPDGAPAAEPAPGPARAQPRYPRGSGPTLPAGPDPALVFKYVKIGGVAVIVLLVLLVLKALFSGGKTATPPASATTSRPATNSAPAANEPALVLTALAPVHVTVERTNADYTQHGELLFDGTMARGETRSISRVTALTITASAAENVIFEINGKRWNMSAALDGRTGQQTGNLPAVQ